MHTDAVRAVVSFLKRLVLVELGGVGLYVGAAAVGHYAKIYRELGLAQFVSFQIAQAAFLFAAQTTIIAILFWRWRKRLSQPRLEQLVAADEHEGLERKSTFRWDLAANKVNKTMERSAMKTIAAFLNTDGGHLVLGVGDDRTIVGMAHDYATLARKDADGLVNHFGNTFNAMLGAHLRHLVAVRTVATDEKECMLVSVKPSAHPVYLKEDGTEAFFIRTGNSTTSLKFSEAAVYIQSHWNPTKK